MSRASSGVTEPLTGWTSSRGTWTSTCHDHDLSCWHPSYVIAGGGEHGAGLTATQSDGFDASETRELLAEQSPGGVPSDSPIEKCKPSFSVIESG